MSELSGTKVNSAHAAGKNGQNQLWYPKAQTYIYIYILYICLSSRVPKLILPGSMGRMNFGTLKLRHIYIYTIYMSRVWCTKVHTAHAARQHEQNGQNELWYPQRQSLVHRVLREVFPLLAVDSDCKIPSGGLLFILN